MNRSIKLTEVEADSLFNKMSERYNVFAPVEKQGEGRLSFTNVISYDIVNGFDDIDFFRQTYFSPKSVLFPTRETIAVAGKNDIEESFEEFRDTIVFLRACDIHAVSVTDAHFLKSGDLEDSYYKRRRDKIKIFLIECEKSFENCYCVSMGTNSSDEYSAFMRKTGSGYEVTLKDKELEQYFSDRDDRIKDPEFVKKNIRSIDIPENIDVSIFKNKMWKEYSARCIACGRCNTSCPTCTCFSVHDIASEEKKDVWQRRRIWSACHVKDFSLLAGNHDMRTVNGDRMRYKTLHKISDFKKRHGFQMCVGCGRCDDVCPEYISMFGCIDKINAVINEKVE